MDTSETYIRMCERAEEVQGQWEPSIGDYILRRYTVFGEPLDSQIWQDKNQKEEIIILHYHSGLPQYWSAVTPDGQTRTAEFPDTNKMVKATHIWLPRQEQLQEMVGGYGAGFVDWREWKANIYPNFRGYKNPFSRLSFNSFEQLWLAFVRKENYGKIWNGEDWINA